ncbi:uncharacterized protein METZ01_LOCUS172079, partial [marine metagenome]
VPLERTITKGSESYDVIIVGAGPAGSAAACYAARGGIRVLLLDKAIFPRDKTCGDALGWKTLSFLREFGLNAEDIVTEKARFDGLRFSGPSGKEAIINLPEDSQEYYPAGWCQRRELFDHILFNNARTMVEEAGGTVIQGFTVKEVIYEDGGHKIVGVRGQRILESGEKESMDFRASLTIGAGGYNCPVSRSMIGDTFGEPLAESSHYAAAYRQYWRGVDGCSNHIEVHFLDELSPGYFWIFPVSDDVVNVGLGCLQKELDARSTKLRAMMEYVIKESPIFSPRFANAKLEEGSGRGFKLPLGSPRKSPPSGFQPRRSAMAGGVLIGDAASLVDPFSGEGIGNAIHSAEIAISHFSSADNSKGFPESAANNYQRELWRAMRHEMSHSAMLQTTFLRSPKLMNLYISKVGKKKVLQNVLFDLTARRKPRKSSPSKLRILLSLLF